MNPDLEEETVSVSDWNRNHLQSQTDQLYFPVSQLKTGSEKTGSVTTQYGKSYCQCQHIIFIHSEFTESETEVEDWNWKQTAHWHQKFLFNILISLVIYIVDHE